MQLVFKTYNNRVSIYHYLDKKKLSNIYFYLIKTLMSSDKTTPIIGIKFCCPILNKLMPWCMLTLVNFHPGNDE